MASQLDVCDNFSDLFNLLESLLHKCYKTKPLAIFTLPERGSSSYLYRTVWNRSIVENNYDVSRIEQYLSKDFLMKIIPAGFLTENNDKGSEPYVYVDAGESEGQRYVVFFGDIENKFRSAEVLQYFTKILKNQFTIVKKWKKSAELNFLIHSDDVTALYNQRKLYIDLEASIKRYNEKGEKFVVLFIDIDHFKDVNDGHGHLVGTMLLVEMAKVLKNVMRETDLIYRYGGDEFVIIVPDVTKDIAIKIGTRLLNAIKESTFQIRGGKIYKLSTSIGIAEFPESAKTIEDILDIADKMMYHAKAGGRGKVCMAGELFE